MCGIVGFIGENGGINNVLEGLMTLEYRGYDSAGVAFFDKQHKTAIEVIKEVGTVDKLIAKVKKRKVTAEKNICIGHTRWATHGGVTENNAHPHLSSDRRFAVVHNGIIENYQSIVSFLRTKNIIMATETDSEVIPNLIQYYYKGNLHEAVQNAINHLQGSYAFLVMSKTEPDTLICAKHGMPLNIGICSDFILVTSDIPTLSNKTDTVYILENGETAELKKNEINFYLGTKRIHKQIVSITNRKEAISKQNFSSYMEKEINEIPQVFDNLITHYRKHKINDEILTMLNGASTIHIVACGTAYHAGMTLGSLLERHCLIRARVHVASEFRYNHPLIFKKDITIVISQSGETADTLAALDLSKSKGIPVIAVCNTDNSTIARKADYYFPTVAGLEIAVASTKAYCAQTLFSAVLINSLYSFQNGKELFPTTEFMNLSNYAREVVSKSTEIRALANIHKDIARVFFVGKDLDSVTSLEAALKVKEITYLQCEGYPAGELKHGTLSLVDNNTLTIVYQTIQELKTKTANAAAEVAARGSKVITINSSRLSASDSQIFKTIIPKSSPSSAYPQMERNPIQSSQKSTGMPTEFLPEIKKRHPIGMTECMNPDYVDSRKAEEEPPQANELHDFNIPSSPLSFTYSIIPAQLFALHLCELKNLNPDKPRNLAKSVTVE